MDTRAHLELPDSSSFDSEAKAQQQTISVTSESQGAIPEPHRLKKDRDSRHLEHDKNEEQRLQKIRNEFWYCHLRCEHAGPHREESAVCFGCDHERCENCLTEVRYVEDPSPEKPEGWDCDAPGLDDGYDAAADELANGNLVRASQGEISWRVAEGRAAETDARDPSSERLSAARRHRRVCQPCRSAKFKCDLESRGISCSRCIKRGKSCTMLESRHRVSLDGDECNTLPPWQVDSVTQGKPFPVEESAS